MSWRWLAATSMFISGVLAGLYFRESTSDATSLALVVLLPAAILAAVVQQALP